MFTVAVSSRALFNLEDGHEIYVREGQCAFDAYMRKTEKKPLRPGAAFPLIQKLLALNVGVPPIVEVVLLSSNSFEASGRIMHSVRHHGLNIDRAFFTSGGERFRLAKSAGVSLFLSTNGDEARNSIQSGIASACVMPTSHAADTTDGIRLAFDGDSVLFSDEAERRYQDGGLTAFAEGEQRNAHVPLGPGPFKPVLHAVHEIQTSFAGGRCPIRVALVTARGFSAADRVLKTFRVWGINVDEAYFCAGTNKGPYLQSFGADLFFDDSWRNVENASQFVPSGHVLHGVLNETSAAIPAPVS